MENLAISLNKVDTSLQPSLKYGLLAGITGIAISLTAYFGGINEHLRWLNIPVMFISIVLAIREQREKKQGGFIEFRRAFDVAFNTYLVFAGIISLYNWVYYKFINHAYFTNQINGAISKIKTKPITPEQINWQIHIVEKMMTPMTTIVSEFFLSTILWSLMILYISYMMHKPKPKFVSL